MGILDKLKPVGDEQFGWVDDDDCYWSDRLSYVLGQFKFCGCGAPEAAAQYIRDGLQAYVDLWRAIRASPSMSDEARVAWRRFEAHWPDAGQRYFFWYWLDANGLTEHGGSVPGWLTDKGEDYLAALNIALEDLGDR
jgi:hypothetical protein